MTGISVVIGFALGMPSLAAQAFGAGSYERCGELLQRTMAIHLLVILPPVIAVWMTAERLLIAMQQPPAVARLTQVPTATIPGRARGALRSGRVCALAT